MIYKTISKCDFHDEFNAIRPDNFSYDALNALYDYFDNLSDETSDKGFELDVIAICCDYCEQSISSIMEDYDTGLDEDADNDAILEWLNKQTFVLWNDSESVLYQAF